eukprot:Gb_13892 [translate_table: standard]
MGNCKHSCIGLLVLLCVAEMGPTAGKRHHLPAPPPPSPPPSLLSCTLGTAAQMIPCLPSFGFNFSGNMVGGNWGWSPQSCCQALSKINPQCFWAAFNFFQTFLPNITLSSAVSTIGACTADHLLAH